MKLLILLALCAIAQGSSEGTYKAESLNSLFPPLTRRPLQGSYVAASFKADKPLGIIAPPERGQQPYYPIYGADEPLGIIAPPERVQQQYFPSYRSLNQQQVADVNDELETPLGQSWPPKVCTYPADSGICLGYFLRFYYNTETHACEIFWYGGCGGNENNFRTYADCEKKCMIFPGVIPRA